MKRIFIITILVAVGTGFLCAQAADSHKDLLKKLDELSNFDTTDFSCTSNLVVARAGKDKEALSIKFFRRDKTDQFMILIDQPNVKKGQGYLKLDKNVWFYDPNTREFSHSSLQENFSGSDSRNEDFGKSSLAADYTVTAFSEEKLGKIDTYKLVLASTANTVPTPFKTIWVTKGQVPLIVQEEDYSLSKRLMRTNRYKDYEQISGRYIWKTALFVNNLVPGEFTQLNLKDISIGKVPDRVFTKNYIEQVSK